MSARLLVTTSWDDGHPSDERLAEASTAALAIVIVGVLPLIAVSRQIAKGAARTSAC